MKDHEYVLALCCRVYADECAICGHPKEQHAEVGGPNLHIDTYQVNYSARTAKFLESEPPVGTCAHLDIGCEGCGHTYIFHTRPHKPTDCAEHAPFPEALKNGPCGHGELFCSACEGASPQECPNGLGCFDTCGACSGGAS